MSVDKLKELIQEVIDSNFQKIIDEFVRVTTLKYPQIDKFEMYYDTSGRFLFLSDLYIKKQYRGTGIGSMVMNRVMEFADKYNLPIVLIPMPENDDDEQLIKFYSKFGFKINNRVFGGSDLIDSMYRLPLKISTSLNESLERIGDGNYRYMYFVDSGELYSLRPYKFVGKGKINNLEGWQRVKVIHSEDYADLTNTEVKMDDWFIVNNDGKLPADHLFDVYIK